MHINAQSAVNQLKKWIMERSGHDQHAAITTSITNLSRWGTWARVGLDVGFPGARWIVKTRGFVNQNVWAIKKAHRKTRKRKEKHGKTRKQKETRADVSLDASGIDKRRGFVG